MCDFDVLHFLYNRGYSDMTLFREMLMRYKCEGSDLGPICDFVFYCRSIHRGKGERDLSYRMIVELFLVFREAGLSLLREVIMVAGGLIDVKRFCLLYSECEDLEPLVSLAVSLANSELRSGGGGKWIPRERRHKELFDRFVRDWFGRPYVTNGMRQEYRYILSESVVLPRPSYTKFMGEYFKAGLRGPCAKTEVSSYSSSSSSWSALLRRVGDCCCGYVPVVDIDIEIQKENLYHALGFACLIAQKSGAWRVLLISGEPIWVDLTSACGDFCAMVSLLWGHCEIRTRSRMSGGLELICSAPCYDSYSNPLRLVLFSETFDFDWRLWVPRFSCPVVFWNIGCRATIPVDLDDYKGLSLMSGYMPGLVGSMGSSFKDLSRDLSRDVSRDLSRDLSRDSTS
jgi:hypothetical protein